MQQYLINTTAIWLLSLVLFDVFLRREKFHGYNRFYLVLTLVLGALLPLVQWPDAGDNSLYPTLLHDPVQRIKSARQTIVAATTPSVQLGWEHWLLIIYVAGGLVAAALLQVDVLKMLRLYSIGKKSASDGWHVIETGKEHAPFSFRHNLFVCSRQQYSTTEWQMILTHEQRHSQLLHIADLLLIQLARIVFWFHPLVYIYNRRLLLVHEYQADNAASSQLQVYGKFLVEQEVLHAAPSIAHSFNRSPIKNRIVMLTRNSSTFAKSKMLILLPLLLLSVACFSKGNKVTTSGFERKGNTVTYKGNKFQLSEVVFDTIILLDPVTGKEETQIRQSGQEPIAMNGKKIYTLKQVTTEPQPMGRQYTIEQSLVTNLALKFNAFPDGIYRVDINNIIIDDKGKAVYYEYGGISARDRADNKINVPEELAKKMETDISYLVLTGTMKPATLNGENVAVNSEIFMFAYEFKVHDHITTYSPVDK